MPPPPFVHLNAEEDYREHFEREYCCGPAMTFDGIAVRFRKSMFDHCFFDSVRNPDDTFSSRRAIRIDWIAAALKDASGELFIGWDAKKKRALPKRRVTLVWDCYVVVIEIRPEARAEFITAYPVDDRGASNIRAKNPGWK